MRYLCLGYFDEEAWNAMPESEQNTFMEKCFAYDDVLNRGGHFVRGEALQGAATATTLRLRDGRVSITDGPFAETREQLGGVLVLEAEDLDQAIELISKHPGLGAGPFEIRPIDEEFTARVNERLVRSAS